MLLLKFPSDGVLVTEDEVNFSAWARQIRTEHDSPGSLVIKLFSTLNKVLFEKFKVTTTAVTSILVLDFILNNKWFFTKYDWSGEGSRDGMVSSLGFGYETLVISNNRFLGFFYLPFSDVAECLRADWSLLSSF